MFTIHISERNHTMSRRGRKRYVQPRRKRYGKVHILVDFLLTIFTGGLWLLWIFIRFLRSNS